MTTVHISIGRVSRWAETATGQGLGWLSASERLRLGGITAAARRSQFVAGRWFARQLLASAYGGHPAQWQLSAPEVGPPRVEPDSPSDLHISLSHSGDHLAGAVAPTPVGVDLEAPRRPRDFLALANAICSPGEVARLRAARPDAREALFYECWTLKEAWLKARAEELSPGRLAQIGTAYASPGSAGHGRTWRAGGFTLALVANPAAHLHWIGEVPGECGNWRINDAAVPAAPAHS